MSDARPSGGPGAARPGPSDPDRTPGPDRRQMTADHLDRLWPVTDPPCWVCVGVGGDHYLDGGKVRHGRWNDHHLRWPAQRGELLDLVEAAAPAADLYVTPGRRANPVRNDKAKHQAGRFLWADLDGARPAQLARLDQLLRAGSITVDSGRGPGHVHFYLALDQLTPPQAVKALNRRLVAYLGGDPSPSALSGYLRPAGSFNHKPVLLGGGPPALVAVAQVSDSGPLWTVGELDQSIPAAKASSSSGAGINAEPLPEPIPAAVAAILADPLDASMDRSRRHFELVVACRRAGLSDGQTITAARAHAPSAAKFGRRLDAETLRVLAKVHPPPAGENNGKRDDDNDDADDLRSWVEPLDWAAFLSEDPGPSSEWLVEPIIPAGRQVAIGARAKVGKSLLSLDVACAKACGLPVLGGLAGDPVDVIYIDMENPAEDLRDRVLDLGYTAASDLSRLHYFHMPALPPLDTDLGAAVLAAQVERFGAVLVIVDTTASSVGGGENDADTYRSFYRHTGRRLRALGAALVRLDHGGKDRTKGQRGSSAKDDDVDVVFEMTDLGDQFVLKRTRSRVAWVPPEVRFRRQEEPLLRHVLEPVALAPGALDVAEELDRLGVPLDATVRAAETALRKAGNGRRRDVVAAALKYRRRPR